MSHVIVYTAEDNGANTVYGPFRNRATATRRMEQMSGSLDPDRDVCGGGVGSLQVCRIDPPDTWEEQTS